jgi:hypothetical protein
MENKKKCRQKFANKSVNIRLKSWVVFGKKHKKSPKSARIKKLKGFTNKRLIVAPSLMIAMLLDCRDFW